MYYQYQISRILLTLIVVTILTACASGTDDNSANSVADGSTPKAIDDTFTTPQNTATTIDLVGNDLGLADTPIVTSIFSAPDNGSVTVLDDGMVSYTPATDFAGNDSFVYQITDNNGDFATATASVEVTCESCAASTTVSISWDQIAENVLGYNLYFAKSSTATDAIHLLESVSVTAEGFEPSSPSVSYDAWNDLGLYQGDSVCFRVKAYNVLGTSGYSQGVCTTL